jgi:hypothetical protein
MQADVISLDNDTLVSVANDLLKLAEGKPGIVILSHPGTEEHIVFCRQEDFDLVVSALETTDDFEVDLDEDLTDVFMGADDSYEVDTEIVP